MNFTIEMIFISDFQIGPICDQTRPRPLFFHLDFVKLVHPNQSKNPTYVLNNAIGNVFASSKER